VFRRWEVRLWGGRAAGAGDACCADVKDFGGVLGGGNTVDFVRGGGGSIFMFSSKENGFSLPSFGRNDSVEPLCLIDRVGGRESDT
jgi:hypothetical protein